MYTIEWKRPALDFLTALWMAGSEIQRSEVAGAFARIKDRLQSDPEGESESRDQGQRVLIEKPLGVAFVVDSAVQQVSVLRVWTF